MRFFCALCHDHNEDFECLLLHTTIQWLSKDACMTHFYSCDSVIKFLSGNDCQLTKAVIPLTNGITYLKDIFTFMNEVIKKLHGEIYQIKSVLMLFILKLSLYKKNMGRNILSQFPNLPENAVAEDKQLKYCLHLHNLVKDKHICFPDLFNLNVPG